jgi:hypothetical protein
MPNLDLINQEYNELRYNRKHIDSKIREAILSNPDMLEKIDLGVHYLGLWMNQEFQPKKQARVDQLKGADLRDMVTEIFVGIAYFRHEELFTSVTAQLAHKLGLSDKVDAITTVAEIVAVLGHTDAFDINKPAKMASLVVVSRIPLEPTLIEFIEDSQYLPPMVCEPRKLVDNYSSGYLTHNDSLILGQGNHHEGDICLDVLNTMNQVPLRLNIDMLCKYEEKPTFDLDTADKKDQWIAFKKQSYRFYEMIVSQGNKFWLTHKVDKRGRIYAQGYHINTQGASFKKAMVQLAEGEYIEGVPNF